MLYLYLGLLSSLPFCCSKFVNKEVENSNEMLIKSVRELKRFPHLRGGFTSQYAPVGWEFAKICNDVKSNPHIGPGWGGGVGVSIDKCSKRVKIFRDSHDPKKVIKLTYQSKLGDF